MQQIDPSPRCANCAELLLTSRKKCGACKAVTYCTKECQREHWNDFHKYLCNKTLSDFEQKILRTNLRYQKAGSRPRCILDDFISFPEDANQQYHEVVIKQICDYHAWCVDENNEIHDYPVHQIARDSPKWTDKVVRRPWDICHAFRAFPSLIMMQERSANYLRLVEPLSHEERLAMIKNNTFPENFCLARATTLRQVNPTKYVVVIGSLGFVQEDGSIFWEYG